MTNYWSASDFKNKFEPLSYNAESRGKLGSKFKHLVLDLSYTYDKSANSNALSQTPSYSWAYCLLPPKAPNIYYSYIIFF